MTAAELTVEGERRHEAGFTLVELLVALALLSFVSLALFGSLRFGILAWGRGAAQTERVEHIAFAQNLLRRLVADAYPLFVSDGPTRRYVAFDGSTKSLAFLSSAPVVLGSGRSWFTFVLDRRGTRTDLVMTSRMELADREDASTLIRKVLLPDVDRVEFSYFGRSRSDRVAQWRDHWTGEMTLPELVRVRIDFPEGKGRLWPELLIAPRIAADVGCAYDTLTKRCRGR